MARSRGLVMETGDEWAIVLLANGKYKRVRNPQELQVGEIYYNKVTSSYRYLAVAAVFLLMLLATIDFFSVAAYARLSSGIELGVNRWDRIVSAKALDTSGEQLLQESKLKGQDLDNALKMLLERSLEKGPAGKKAGDREITISVVVKSQADEKLQERLLLEINNAVQTTLNKRTHNGQFELLKQNGSLMIKPLNRVKAETASDGKNGNTGSSESSNNNGKSKKGENNKLPNSQQKSNKDAEVSKSAVPASTTQNEDRLQNMEEEKGKLLPKKGNKIDGEYNLEIESKKPAAAKYLDEEKVKRKIKDDNNIKEENNEVGNKKGNK